MTELRTETEKLRGLLWYAWSEMNAIRAESGVPRGYDGHPKAINEDYWSGLVDAMQAALGKDAQPWPSEAAKQAFSFLPQTGEGGTDHANVEAVSAEEVARMGLVPRSEVERLQDTLERERSQVATGIGAVKEAIRKREWLRLGRGSFEWDDERWKDEFGHAIDEILQAMEPLRSIACDWSDCPTDRERIKRARDGTPAPMSEGEREPISVFLSNVRAEWVGVLAGALLASLILVMVWTIASVKP